MSATDADIKEFLRGLYADGTLSDDDMARFAEILDDTTLLSRDNVPTEIRLDVSILMPLTYGEGEPSDEDVETLRSSAAQVLMRIPLVQSVQVTVDEVTEL